MRRVYEAALAEHIREHRQMVMLSGPRQVGKTTTSRASAPDHRYHTWDRQSDRLLITRGPDAVADDLDLHRPRSTSQLVIFDEIHKYRKWSSFLKGFFDVYGDRSTVIVTGSARLNVYRRGGDSLMGRYFPYRMHPLSLAELGSTELSESEIREPVRIDRSALDALLELGGFPEPFLNGTRRFSNRWRRLRTELLFHEDLRDLTRIQEAGQVQVLAELLANQAGQLVNYSSLAGQVNVAVDTIRRWITALESLFFCYTVRPWFRNVPKSLRKQPKVYLWDWSGVADAGARRENLVASHLLKAVQWWTDLGLGEYGLFYLRDKVRREVDFLVTRDGEPWFLVEVKSSASPSLSRHLHYFAGQLQVRHAFQLAFDLDAVEADLFEYQTPVRVPARTLLAQLI